MPWGWIRRSSLDPTAGFFQFGMDSLMSVTLQRRCPRASARCCPPRWSSTIRRSTRSSGYLATILPELIEAADAGSSADDYDDLTEDELLQQLSERLN